MLLRFWRWLWTDEVAERRREEREERAATLAAIREISQNNRDILTEWLQMFKPKEGTAVKGWTSTDESVALQEFAASKGIDVPAALLTGSELDRAKWLEQEMDKEW
mgnify:CR=1 FL=1